MTRLPASAISVAATRPARPPPTTITSASSAIAFPPGRKAIEACGVYRGQRQMAPSRDPSTTSGTLTCSSLGPSGPKVQRGSNTPFEFDLRRPAHLDKIPLPQHAGEHLASLNSIGFGSMGLDRGRI